MLAGVVHVPKLATPLVLPNNTAATKAHQTMKILVAPPPPTLNDKQKKEQQQQAANATTAEPVDMEIEDQSEEVLIEQDVKTGEQDTSKPPPPMPNTSQPPPGYPAKKPEVVPTPFTHQGPPPPFVTNSFMQPPNQVGVISFFHDFIREWIHFSTFCPSDLNLLTKVGQ